MLTPIKIRINASDYDGFLLPDSAHALYVSEGFAFLIAVTSANNQYTQLREAFVVSIEAEEDAEFIADLYRRLTETSAYELLTCYYVEEYDAFNVPLE